VTRHTHIHTHARARARTCTHARMHARTHAHIRRRDLRYRADLKKGAKENTKIHYLFRCLIDCRNCNLFNLHAGNAHSAFDLSVCVADERACIIPSRFSIFLESVAPVLSHMLIEANALPSRFTRSFAKI
jgi:hypothetical protein